jgi:hypothetical protein
VELDLRVVATPPRDQFRLDQVSQPLSVGRRRASGAALEG